MAAWRHTLFKELVATLVFAVLGCDVPRVTRPPQLFDAALDTQLDTNIEALLWVELCGTHQTLGQSCVADAACDDLCFCNGVEQCVENRCALGTAPCLDDVACTADDCVEELDQCLYVPLHSRCSDRLACNGWEQCDPIRGCLEVPPLYCNDEDSCTVDLCDDVLGCVFQPRDLDGDGFVSAFCGGNDCNDTALDGGAIYPGASELCDNGLDDDCDGLFDRQDLGCIEG